MPTSTARGIVACSKSEKYGSKISERRKGNSGAESAIGIKISARIIKMTIMGSVKKPTALSSRAAGVAMRFFRTAPPFFA